jgi:acetyl-CoA carboxylase carboxyl transferase beta subunit
MLKKGIFKKPENTLENVGGDAGLPHPSVPDEMFTTCKACKAPLFSGDLKKNLYVCPKCGKHFPIGARARIGMTADAGSFIEMDGDMVSADYLGFPGYENKLREAMEGSGEKEAVVCGTAAIGGVPCGIFAMESRFMMGSMGSVVGEKITRLFERAAALSLPVVGFTLSGGARMQEGMLSLMQMAKTSGAVKRHSDKGILYIAVLCDPTAGGVTASFAMESDIALAEPGALICFAGPRVIEQTIRQKLPPGFQTAEFLLEKGFIDAITPRKNQQETLSRLLLFHQRRAGHGSV